MFGIRPWEWADLDTDEALLLMKHVDKALEEPPTT